MSWDGAARLAVGPVRVQRAEMVLRASRLKKSRREGETGTI
jgi:hypothetical protein